MSNFVWCQRQIGEDKGEEGVEEEERDVERNWNGGELSVKSKERGGRENGGWRRGGGGMANNVSHGTREGKAKKREETSRKTSQVLSQKKARI